MITIKRQRKHERETLLCALFIGLPSCAYFVVMIGALLVSALGAH